MASQAALLEAGQPVVIEPAPAPAAPVPEDNEDRVWLRLLSLPFAAMSIFLVALFATGIGWFILPALIFGPGGGMFALVYLALSRDVNAEIEPPATAESVAGGRRKVFAMPAPPRHARSEGRT